MKRWKRKKHYMSSWCTVFGLLGLRGCKGVYELFVLGIHNSNDIAYLGFFSFFSCFWLGKYRTTKRDERFLFNEKRALSNSVCTAALLVWVSYRVLFRGPFMSSASPEMMFDLLHIIMNLMFSLFWILYGYLLHRYETK